MRAYIELAVQIIAGGFAFGVAMAKLFWLLSFTE